MFSISKKKSYICGMKRFVWLILFMGVAIWTMGQESAYKEVRRADKFFNFTNQVSYMKRGDGYIYRFVAMMPMPVSNEYQDIAHLTFTEGEVVKDKRYGNQVLVVKRSSFPGMNHTVSSTFDVCPFEVKVNTSKITHIRNYDPNSEPCRKHLGDRGKYIMTQHPYVVRTGDSIWAQSSDLLDYARRSYEYVAKNFRYIKGNWRTLKQILAEGGGECGDFSTLVVNLLRYKGIPSRHNICLKLDGNPHVWVDFYLEGYGWIPLDAQLKNAFPQNDYFGIYNGQCIVMMQDFCYDISKEFPLDVLQTFHYWFWYNNGVCTLSGKHEPNNNGASTTPPVKTM